MSRSDEKNLPSGQGGLVIETEQDPTSASPKALTNAPDGSLKHAVNVDFQGTANLHRRKGYTDNMHRPENKTLEITTLAVAGPVQCPTVGDTIISNLGATLRVLSAEELGGPPTTTLVIRGITTNNIVWNVADTFTVVALAHGTVMVPSPATVAVANYAIDTYDVHCVFDPVTGTFAQTNLTHADVATRTTGIKGLARYTYLDNRGTKSTAAYDLDRYTMFATRAIATAYGNRTLHWRNPATPNIRMLQAPVLDRSIFNAVDAAGNYCFSDVNYNSFNNNRFWNYQMWTRGGERETYLLGTYGGHYYLPDTLLNPPPWNYVVGTDTPVTGNFDQSAVAGGGGQTYKCLSDYAHQRRVLIWFPTWYEWWSRGYAANRQIPEVGLHNWFAPFIWYFYPRVNGTSDFYAEPCGRFIKRYNNSLFMARIERSYLIPGTAQVNDTVGWTYEPSGYMWSFYGLSTGMELGTPPVYPFAIPNEPAERVWGCATANPAANYQLNRHNYFKPADGVPIVGLETWNDRLYIMKPTGFGEVYGSFSGNFILKDLQMSQGPAGAFAWCKADEGIYYITKKGLYLFDGNPASQNVCLSDGRVKKIFEQDIDWRSCTDMLTGEIIGVIMTWDKGTRSVLISYPKRGEQGGGGVNDLPAGTPTRMMVYDTYGQRFTEWIMPLPINSNATNSVCPGIMLSGQDPTDDDYTMITHPIGNAMDMTILCTLPGSVMTVVPNIGGTITQAATGATMIVTAVNLVAGTVQGTNQNTGFWDTVTPIGTISDGAGPMLPDPCTPAVIIQNNNGRLLFHAQTGHRDNVTLDGSAQPEAMSGDRITWDVTSKDYAFGQLKPKLTVIQQRQVIYANNGGIKRKVIYNYYDVNDETELTFGATSDGWYSEKTLIHQAVHTGTDSSLALVSMKYYHDQPEHTALQITFNTGGNPMTATPPIGSVLTQAVTGATLLVTSVNLGTLQVWGQDLGTGVWNTANTVTSVPVGLLPVNVIPSALATVLNPDNTNSWNEPIQFIATSLEVVHMGGDTKSSD